MLRDSFTGPVLVGIAVLTLSAVLYAAGFRRMYQRARASRSIVEQSLVRRLKGPVRILIPLIGLEIAVSQMTMSAQLKSVALHVGVLLLIGTAAWLVVKMTYVFEDVILDHYRLDIKDNLKSRRMHTQIQVFRRVAVAVVIVFAIGLSLLTFSQVRALGAGLLASAGIIGIIAGVAAKPTTTNVIAGLQIAISQPIRIDDVVVVDGHWGRVEEIALTYVVVKIWDLRRLILPISYLITTPFENWTRSSSEILGWVHLEVDYTAPIDEIRTHFEQIVAASPNWDGKVARLQVTNCGTTTIQLRALMSSLDSGMSWDLQCEVREKLIGYLQKEHPGVLPHLRAETSLSFENARFEK